MAGLCRGGPANERPALLSVTRKIAGFTPFLALVAALLLLLGLGFKLVIGSLLMLLMLLLVRVLGQTGPVIRARCSRPRWAR